MLTRRLANWLRDERGAVAPFLVLALVPIIGATALGGEIASWYMKQRQLQNVADSAALAAAANASSGYVNEAKGIASQYNLVPNANGDLTVSTVNNALCPGTSSYSCYQVEITQKIPLYLTQLAGYGGGTTLADGRRATLVRAFAVASGKVAYNYCMTGLGTASSPVNGSGQNNIVLNGNGGDFTECAAQSAGQIKCTSVDFAIIQSPAQQGNTCGSDFSQTTSGVTDPYASKDFTTKITDALGSTPCYSGALTGTIIASVVKVCASNATMTGPITLQAPTGADPPILVIYDTTLNTAGFSVTTTTGVGAKGGTVIVTGAGTTNMNEWFSGDGNVTIQGANGGSFDDMSIIVDPKITTAQAFMPGGGSHVNLTVLGTVYTPATDIAIQGSMSATIGAYSCVSIVAKSIYVNGGSLDNNPLDCKALSFNLDEATVTRQALVQ
jgi:Flp pilus assembly protein TadG